MVARIAKTKTKTEAKTKTKTCVGNHVWVRCGGENMAARVMAYCLACMEAVAREEEER